MGTFKFNSNSETNSNTNTKGDLKGHLYEKYVAEDKAKAEAKAAKAKAEAKAAKAKAEAKVEKDMERMARVSGVIVKYVGMFKDITTLGHTMEKENFEQEVNLLGKEAYLEKRAFENSQKEKGLKMLVGAVEAVVNSDMFEKVSLLGVNRLEAVAKRKEEMSEVYHRRQLELEQIEHEIALETAKRKLEMEKRGEVRREVVYLGAYGPSSEEVDMDSEDGVEDIMDL